MVAILDYYENFADNLSAIAYAKLLKKNPEAKVYYKNSTYKRVEFEKYMSNFDLNINYLSPNNVKELTRQSFLNSRKIINKKNIDKVVNRKKPLSNFLLNHSKLDIKDLYLINDDFKNNFKFKNYYFIKNYDLLEKIQNNQSIGLYISKKDIEKNKVDFEYIYNATKRLNKYIRQPKLYIFTNSNLLKDTIKSEIEYEIINNLNWMEEFYFHKECRHKIILNSDNSYSQNIWATILNEKEYNLIAYSKKTKVKNLKNNWVKV